MGGMKKNGRDFGMPTGEEDGPNFYDALEALFNLCWHLYPELMATKQGREALEEAGEVLKQHADWLPYVPSEEEAREADAKWRTDPSEEF